MINNRFEFPTHKHTKIKIQDYFHIIFGQVLLCNKLLRDSNLCVGKEFLTFKISLHTKKIKIVSCNMNLSLEILNSSKCIAVFFKKLIPAGQSWVERFFYQTIFECSIKLLNVPAFCYQIVPSKSSCKGSPNQLPAHLSFVKSLGLGVWAKNHLLVLDPCKTFSQ